MSKRSKTVYRIFFSTQNKGYEIYARKVTPGELYGFVEVEGLTFGERSSIVVDPGEESLKNEFGNVKRLLIPYQAIARIDEVEKEGPGKIFALSSGNGGTLAGAGSPPPPPLKPRGD